MLPEMLMKLQQYFDSFIPDSYELMFQIRNVLIQTASKLYVYKTYLSSNTSGSSRSSTHVWFIGFHFVNKEIQIQKFVICTYLLIRRYNRFAVLACLRSVRNRSRAGNRYLPFGHLLGQFYFLFLQLHNTGKKIYTS